MYVNIPTSITMKTISCKFTRTQQDDDSQLRILRTIFATVDHYIGEVAISRDSIKYVDRIKWSCH